MAWRIDEHVVRGEIDNRTRGRVTGRIWFAGREAPVELDLQGNAWRDLAGRHLTFVNPHPKPGLDARFASTQRGTVGDITASRKVKVPDIPIEQIGEYYAARKPWPWHWGNSLYLEWHGDTNGRVVIETVAFQLTIAPDATWEMSTEEEPGQRRANGEAFDGFMNRLNAIAESADHAQDKDDVGDDAEDRPQSEAEADAMLAESDRMADRLANRLASAGDDADFEQILEEELERRRRERGDDDRPPTPEEEAERERRIEEMNRAAEEALNDPETLELVRRRHPLAVRAHDLALRLAREPEDRGWITASTQEEHPVAELGVATMQAGAKLAGALNGREWPPSVDECGLAIARLKRAREWLADARAAADACAADQLTDPAWLAEIRGEIDAIREEVDSLIAELRGTLERGFD